MATFITLEIGVFVRNCCAIGVVSRLFPGTAVIIPGIQISKIKTGKMVVIAELTDLLVSNMPIVSFSIYCLGIAREKDKGYIRKLTGEFCN